MPCRKAPVPDSIRALHKGSTKCQKPSWLLPWLRHPCSRRTPSSAHLQWLEHLGLFDKLEKYPRELSHVEATFGHVVGCLSWLLPNTAPQREGAASEVFDWLRPVTSHTYLWFFLQSVLDTFSIIEMTLIPPLLWSQHPPPSSSKLLQLYLY